MFGKKEVPDVLFTTTNKIEGFEIERYCGVLTSEVVGGTGFLSESLSRITDTFGARSGIMETKLDKARKAAFDLFASKASEVGANCVLAVDIDYTEVDGNFALIVSGTAVAGKWKGKPLT